MDKQKLKDRIKLLFKYWPTMILYTVMSHPVVARDLESIANNLTSKTSKIAGSLVPIGFAIAAAFMAFGSPRGAQYMSSTLLAAVVGLGGSSIFTWLKGIVG
jgi:hypothetical protein